MRRSLQQLMLVALAGATLAGCNSKPVRDPDFAPVPPVVPQAAQQNTGSIYQAGFERSWFENVRARRVGDILVVTLVEDTEASHTNSGSISKSNATSLSNPTLFGHQPSFALPNSKTPGTLAFGLDSSSEFSGSGDNTQNNEFSGSISVMVTQVLGNGYLAVRGEKRISMTGGNEYIRVAGIVRPEDIDIDNTIDSTKIADATLTYVGDGQVSMASEMGWLAKFFISAIMPW